MTTFPKGDTSSKRTRTSKVYHVPELMSMFTRKSLEIYSKFTLNLPECSPKVHLNVHFMCEKARKSEKTRAILE